MDRKAWDSEQVQSWTVYKCMEEPSDSIRGARQPFLVMEPETPRLQIKQHHLYSFIQVQKQTTAVSSVDLFYKTEGPWGPTHRKPVYRLCANELSLKSKAPKSTEHHVCGSQHCFLPLPPLFHDPLCICKLHSGNYVIKLHSGDCEPDFQQGSSVAI